jgi:N-acetylglutamate synthase-like GNAT family acetyltransferase
MAMSMRPAADEERSGAPAGVEVRIIEVDGVVVGRVTVRPDEDGDALRIEEVEIVPERRGEGIGSAVLRQLDEESARAGTELTAVVAADHRARAFFERAGFSGAGELLRRS